MKSVRQVAADIAGWGEAFAKATAEDVRRMANAVRAFLRWVLRGYEAFEGALCDAAVGFLELVLGTRQFFYVLAVPVFSTLMAVYFGGLCLWGFALVAWAVIVAGAFGTPGRFQTAKSDGVLSEGVRKFLTHGFKYGLRGLCFIVSVIFSWHFVVPVLKNELIEIRKRVAQVASGNPESGPRFTPQNEKPPPVAGRDDKVGVSVDGGTYPEGKAPLPTAPPVPDAAPNSDFSSSPSLPPSPNSSPPARPPGPSLFVVPQTVPSEPLTRPYTEADVVAKFEGVCNGNEACVFRDWVVRSQANLYSSPDTSNVIANSIVKPGEVVRGITSLLKTTRVGRLRMTETGYISTVSHAVRRAAQGAEFDTYYWFKGCWRVMFKGEYANICGACEVIDIPEIELWVRLRTANGEDVWSNKPLNFCGIVASDQCAGSTTGTRAEVPNGPGLSSEQKSAAPTSPTPVETVPPNTLYNRRNPSPQFPTVMPRRPLPRSAPTYPLIGARVRIIWADSRALDARRINTRLCNLGAVLSFEKPPIRRSPRSTGIYAPASQRSGADVVAREVASVMRLPIYFENTRDGAIEIVLTGRPAR